MKMNVQTVSAIIRRVDGIHVSKKYKPNKQRIGASFGRSVGIYVEKNWQGNPEVKFCFGFWYDRYAADAINNAAAVAAAVVAAGYEVSWRSPFSFVVEEK